MSSGWTDSADQIIKALDTEQELRRNARLLKPSDILWFRRNLFDVRTGRVLDSGRG